MRSGRAARVTLLPLLAMTYFMASSGPYGLEELVRDAGYPLATAVLILTPLLWSLPTTLMVSELATAMPAEGGFYVWVRRALGPFWGFQVAWLALISSIFDMALYPALFVGYLSHLSRLLGGPNFGVLTPWRWIIGISVLLVCVAVNLRGARAVGRASLLLTVVLLAPFVVLVAAAFGHPSAPVAMPTTPGKGLLPAGLMSGILVAMWNFMGWDNASTIGGEVDRPQRTYPLAMGGALILVAATYLIPIAAARHAGIGASEWDNGFWVIIGQRIVGPGLGIAIAACGMVAAFAACNALVMSYSRLPVVLSEDGFLPAIFQRRLAGGGAPWVAILVCAVAWSLALGLPFDHLVALDVILYGLSLMLEFAALVALRIRAPEMKRPFRIPGGLPGVSLLGVGPAALIAWACYDKRLEKAVIGGFEINGLVLGSILVLLGPAVFVLRKKKGAPAVREPLRSLLSRLLRAATR